MTGKKHLCRDGVTGRDRNGDNQCPAGRNGQAANGYDNSQREDYRRGNARIQRPHRVAGQHIRVGCRGDFYPAQVDAVVPAEHGREAIFLEWPC